MSGQDGSYLAELLLEKGYRVVGTSRDAHVSRLRNLARLGIADSVEVYATVLTDFRSVLDTLSKVRPDEIYNLAGQSSVGLSFQQPVETLESITIGVLNLLEAVRFLKLPARIYNASSSECFGDTNGVAADEQTPFKPRSPYATAKAAAHWTVVNYREAYGLFACNGILFNHESPLRPTHFVTRKVVARACEIAQSGKGKLDLGNLSIQRDWGWAPEYVDAMWRMLQLDLPDDFVIATGESHTLEEFCRAVFEQLELDFASHVEVNEELLRPSEIMFGQGNASKARDTFGWQPEYRMRDVVSAMVAAELKLSGLAANPRSESGRTPDNVALFRRVPTRG